MRNFRNLNIWKKGLDIAKLVYSIFLELPDYEKFGLQIQLAKSSVSIPSNIAESCATTSDRDFKRFLEFPPGSAYELETQLLLAFELHQIKTETIVNKVQDEQRMIVSLINKL